MRIAFLWSLVYCSNIIKQHVVIQLPVLNYGSLIKQTLSHGIDPYYKDRKLIRFTNEIPYFKEMKDETIVPMSVLYRKHGVFPQFHMFSRSHYLQFSHSLYASVMNYADFCAMEDKLAHIVLQYLEDTNGNWLIGIEDPFLMSSLRSYGGKKPILDQTTWITMKKTTYHDMIVMDMDTDHPHV